MKITDPVKTRASLIAAYDAIEVLAVSVTGPNTLWPEVVERAHVNDIVSELVRRDPSMVVEVMLHLETGNDDAAREMVQVALMGLSATDPALFTPTMDREELYKLWLSVEGGLHPVTQQSGRIGFTTSKMDDWRYAECMNAGQVERRRKAYELAHAAKVKAREKRAKKKAANAG